MIDPSRRRRPDPAVGLLTAVVTSVALVAAVPVALWALANPANALATAMLLGATVASYRFCSRLATDRSASRSRSPRRVGGSTVRTDGAGDSDR